MRVKRGVPVSEWRRKEGGFCFFLALKVNRAPTQGLDLCLVSGTGQGTVIRPTIDDSDIRLKSGTLGTFGFFSLSLAVHLGVGC